MIVLFTDFGLQGPYIGQIKAVLQQQAPGAPVIDLFSDLPPFDIEAAAYLLPAYAGGFPPGTVFMCVVDPGVGSARPGVLVRADSRWFVGPNEGLFSQVVRRSTHSSCRELALSPGASSSFHGRDVFAPAAARVARGVPVDGVPVAMETLEQPDWPDELYRVVYIDRFGNAMTGVRASAVAADAVLDVNGHALKCARTYSDVTPGTAFWYANANGLVEFAVNRGRADEILTATVGTRFECR